MAIITKPIPSHPDYSITENGVVFRNGKILKQYKDRRGYPAVYLYNGTDKRTYMSIHRAVMLAHCPNKNYANLTVNHKDGNKENNHISNLEWMTNAENIRHAFATGIRRGSSGKRGKCYAISKEVLNEMFEIYTNTKISVRKLAKQYGVGRGTVQNQFNNNYKVTC